MVGSTHKVGWLRLFTPSYPFLNRLLVNIFKFLISTFGGYDELMELFSKASFRLPLIYIGSSKSNSDYNAYMGRTILGLSVALLDLDENKWMNNHSSPTRQYNDSAKETTVSYILGGSNWPISGTVFSGLSAMSMTIEKSGIQLESTDLFYFLKQALIKLHSLRKTN